MSEKIATERLIDMANGRLSPEESLELLKQIESDPDASARLDVVAGLTVLAAEDPEAFSEPARQPDRMSWSDRLGLLVRRLVLGRRPLLRFGLAGTAVAVLSVMLLVFSSRGDPYARLVDLRGIGGPLQLRGGVDEDIRSAQELMAAGDHGRAIAVLERRLRIFPQDEMCDYLHYTVGIIYLVSAEQSRFMVRSFDRQAVKSAIDHLDVALKITSSTRLREDARWFLAQSHLAAGEIESARGHLLLVATQAGPHASDAARQIELLDGLHTGY